MLTKIAFIVGIVAAVTTAATIGEPRRPNYDNIKYYNCAYQPDGNYTHPFDCTRFIICSNGRAADMACPDCGTNAALCVGESYLRWNQTIERCEWPLNTECPFEGIATTSSDPNTEYPGTTPQDHTETPTSTTIAPPALICNGTKAGDSCNENDCELCGYCQNKLSYYYRCNRTIPDDPHQQVTGEIVRESCDSNLWWNPTLKPTGSLVGGSCGTWGGLPQAVKDAYKNDPNCVNPLCEWGQDEKDKCTGQYWYLDPPSPREDLTCENGLIWDPKTETCRARQNVAGC